MIRGLSTALDRVRKPNRKRRFIDWIKEFPEFASEMNRPIDYIVEGGPILRGKVALSIVITMVLGSWIGAEFVTGDLSQRITLFSSITNILMTVGLIWVYLSIAESERTQAEFVREQTNLQKEIQSLQETQVEVMAAEFEPVIEILDYGSSNSRPQISSVSFDHGYPYKGDQFKVELTNLSDAIAINLRLRFVLDYMGQQSYATGSDIPLIRVDNGQSLTSKPGGVLQGQESEIEYHCVAGLHIPMVEREDALPMSICLSNMFDNGISHVRLGVVLVFEDRKGKEHEIDLEGLEVTQSDFSNGTPSLGRVRNVADKVPIGLVRARLLSEGISQIPPPYRHR